MDTTNTLYVHPFSCGYHAILFDHLGWNVLNCKLIYPEGLMNIFSFCINFWTFCSIRYLNLLSKTFRTTVSCLLNIVIPYTAFRFEHTIKFSCKSFAVLSLAFGNDSLLVRGCSWFSKEHEPNVFVALHMETFLMLVFICLSCFTFLDQYQPAVIYVLTVIAFLHSSSLLRGCLCPPVLRFSLSLSVMLWWWPRDVMRQKLLCEFSFP